MLDKINFGDIVTVRDYPERYFAIVGKQTQYFEHVDLPDETDYMLDVRCVHTGAETLAYIEDVTIVALKAEADAFLSDKPAPKAAPRSPYGMLFGFNTIFGGDDMREKPTKAQEARKQTKQERIDALLDDWIDNATKAQAAGDVDGAYAESNAAIEAEIKELSRNPIR